MTTKNTNINSVKTGSNVVFTTRGVKCARVVRGEVMSNDGTWITVKNRWAISHCLCRDVKNLEVI